MSRSSTVRLHRRRSADTLTWTLVAAAVLVQIGYPLTVENWRTPMTVLSVVVFAAASLADCARVHGIRGAATLVVVAGGGGLLAESVGVSTGFPFGAYCYSGTLGPTVVGVPVIVPLAWLMMAWPALVVGRTITASPVAVPVVGGLALAVWDVFLDPQMVDAGHWSWVHPDPALPLVPGIPLTNYAGWIVVSVLIVGAIDRVLPGAPASRPALTLYLWVYSSSVLAHLVFFGLAGSAMAGGLLMGLVVAPLVVRLRTTRGRGPGGSGGDVDAGRR